MSPAISNARDPWFRLLTGSRNRPPRFQAVEYDGRFFVNPGSATGAWTGLWNGCVSHVNWWGLLMRATLTRILQGADSFVCADGHSGPSGRHVCIPVDRWRSSGGENRVSEGRRPLQRATSECSVTSEHPEQSLSSSTTAKCVVIPWVSICTVYCMEVDDQNDRCNHQCPGPPREDGREIKLCPPIYVP